MRQWSVEPIVPNFASCQKVSFGSVSRAFVFQRAFDSWASSSIELSQNIAVPPTVNVCFWLPPDLNWVFLESRLWAVCVDRHQGRKV